MFGCCNFRQILASRSSFWKSATHYSYSVQLQFCVSMKKNQAFMIKNQARNIFSLPLRWGKNADV